MGSSFYLIAQQTDLQLATDDYSGNNPFAGDSFEKGSLPMPSFAMVAFKQVRERVSPLIERRASGQRRLVFA